MCPCYVLCDWHHSCLSTGVTVAWRGRSVAAFTNLPIDIDSGVRWCNVWMNGFAVKVDALPAQIVNPIATYSALWLRAASERGTDRFGMIPMELMSQICDASFGPGREAWKQYRLTRMIWANLVNRNTVSFAALKMVGENRAAPPGPPGPPAPPASSRWSATKKVAVGAAVVGVPTGLYFLGRALRWWK